MLFKFIAGILFFSTTGHSYSQTQIIAAKKSIVARSITSYRGSCPCPYNTTRAGRRCGKRSAYSRPSGASPICYIQNITDDRALRFLGKTNPAY